MTHAIGDRTPYFLQVSLHSYCYNPALTNVHYHDYKSLDYPEKYSRTVETFRNLNILLAERIESQSVVYIYFDSEESLTKFQMTYL